METLERILAQHPFFEALEPEYLKLLVGCASNVRFEARTYIFRRGEEANQFYLLRQGRAALEIFAPQRPPITIATLEKDDVLGLVLGGGAVLLAFGRAGGGTHAGYRARRQMPSHEVRREPRSRLRAAEALCPHRRKAPRGNPFAATGCLCAPPLRNSPRAAAVFDPMLPHPCRVEGVVRGDAGHVHVRAGIEDAEQPRFAPGQFSMLYVFGVGELPISISGDPEEPHRLVYTVRSVGPATQALVSRRAGRLAGGKGAFRHSLAARGGAREGRADRCRRHRSGPATARHLSNPAAPG